MLCLQLKESKQAVNSIRRLVEEDDDEDDVEKVSWSGEPVGSKLISVSIKHLCTILSYDWLQGVDCLPVFLRYLMVSQRDSSVQSEDRQRARLPQNQH